MQIEISRIYYGNNRNKKPNNHCYWDNDNNVIGWYESDKHLKDRINKEIECNTRTDVKSVTG